MTDRMTMDEIDREIERLRTEKQQVMAVLRDPDGGGLRWRRPGGNHVTVSQRLDDIDWQIERLRAQRQRVAARLRDPDESGKRRGRRAMALARWVQTLELTPEQLKQMRALADAEDRGLFADEVLTADGFTNLIDTPRQYVHSFFQVRVLRSTNATL